MGWLSILVLVIGAYYILPMIFEHRERMAQIRKDKDNGDSQG